MLKTETSLVLGTMVFCLNQATAQGSDATAVQATSYLLGMLLKF